MEYEKGELLGSEPGTAGSSKETLLFSGCVVEGNGEKCEVGPAGEEGKITTVRLENWLDKEKKESAKGEPYLVGFKPAEGVAVATVKFKGEKCTVKETTLEITKAGELAFAGNAENEGTHKIELKVPETETFGTVGFIDFPEKLLAQEFVEKNKAVTEVKEKLSMFGKAVTRFEGRIKLELNVKAWGIFGV